MRLSALALALGLGLAGLAVWRHGRMSPGGEGASGKDVAAVARGPVTFNRDIAPILFQNCSTCHRPGQAAPFALLNFEDAKKHARQIAEVTARRYMPPWLPEPGYGEFRGERRLSEGQIELIRRWAAEGAVEGAAGDLPRAPEFAERWRLGRPDLVVTLPRPYALAAEGKDVYRNFVFPIPSEGLRYVKGVEFLPGNARVLHHAFVDVDETRQSRRVAERQDPPGFDGMELPETALMPGGQFLGWQPGKVPYFSVPGLGWSLKPGTDLVLQLHMHPSGRPETVQPEIGFYFTDEVPTNMPFRVALKCFELDIPAGATNYAVEQTYVLPVNAEVLRVSTHAHYLAKEMQGYAILPDGAKRWLIRIGNWDFNWQGDYEYARPQFLPKGTRLVMHYTYDNSTNNVRNPHQPPRRVEYGLQTTDEMGELWFQVLTRGPEERERLAIDYFGYLVGVTMSFDRYRIRRNPADAAAHTRLGRTLIRMGRFPEAREHLTAAVRVAPGDDQAHYELAVLCMALENWREAERELLEVTRLNASDYQAYGNLGEVYRRTGRFDEARTCFEAALRLNPDDAAARRLLDLLPARGRPLGENRVP